MRISIVLETTANKILCVGSEFTVIIKILNDCEPAEVTLEHCLGKQLRVCNPPPYVHVKEGKCECYQVLRIHATAKHGCTRLTYNVKVTEHFLLPMGRTCVKLISIDGQRCRIDSNPVSLGLTPITPKPFTVSGPVACTCFCTGKVIGCHRCRLKT